MIYLAKCNPSQTYEEHVTAVYRVWLRIKEVHRATIEAVCKRHGIEPERFLISSLLTVALHDIGKMCVNFQRIMYALTEAEKLRWIKQNYRHEYASVSFVAFAAIKLNQERGPLLPTAPRLHLEALAVLGHHKFVDGGLRRFEREVTNGGSLKWHGEGVQEGVTLARRLFEERGWQFPELDLKGCMETARKIPKYAMPNGQTVTSSEAIREVFCLLKGLLMTADWGASHGKGLNTAVSVRADAVKPYMVDKGKEDGWVFDDFKVFQKDCAAAPGHVIAVAPTGSGKTEAALLWALGQIERGAATKMLYLLPTMITANDLHGRMEKFFSRHDMAVGLSHSLADLVRRSESEPEEGAGDSGALRSQILFDRHFVPPVTVATVDQLLTTFFQRGRWPLKTFGAMNAAVVLDEIHAYDPYTTGLIFEMIRQLRRVGTRFMVMSATLPESLVAVFREELGGDGEVTVVRDRDLLSQARSRYRVVDDDLFNHTDKIRQFVREGKRVLVVLNTVGRCQELSTLLTEMNPICLHSKFILRDRQAKEDKVLREHPSLVIATQVVEVALDIDFDVLMTECAPPDALCQRAGRINRRRERKGEVVIFCPGPGSQHIYEADSREEVRPGEALLERSFQGFAKRDGMELTEQDLLNIVEEVYGSRRVNEHFEFRHAQQLVHDWQGRLYGLLDPIGGEEDADTRLDKYRQESVIPLMFRREVLDAAPRDRRRYEIKMPFWYVRKNQCFEDDIRFCEMQYDTHLGARFKEKEDSLRMF